MASYSEHITCREGHGGGYPVLQRLNVSVRVIVEMSKQVADFGELCANLSQCTPEELRAALDYYEAHRELIDQDIERNRKVLEAVVAGRWHKG